MYNICLMFPYSDGRAWWLKSPSPFIGSWLLSRHKPKISIRAMLAAVCVCVSQSFHTVTAVTAWTTGSGQPGPMLLSLLLPQWLAKKSAPEQISPIASDCQMLCRSRERPNQPTSCFQNLLGPRPHAECIACIWTTIISAAVFERPS